MTASGQEIGYRDKQANYRGRRSCGCRWRPFTSVECRLLGDTENLGHTEKWKSVKGPLTTNKATSRVCEQNMKILKTGWKK